MRAQRVGKRKYPAATIPPMVRDALARVARVLHEDGMKVEAIGNAYKKAGFPLSRATLYSHIASVASKGTPMSQDKASGRKRALDQDQRDVMAGLFLTREDQNLVSSLSTYQAFADVMFGVQLHESTASRYLDESYLSYKLMGPRKRAGKKDSSELAVDALESLQMLHDGGYLLYDLSKLWCIDVVTDTQKDQRVKSFGRLGGTQRKLLKSNLTHTSSMITLVNAKGRQLGPGLFTSNPDLDPDGANGQAVRRFCKRIGWSVHDLFFVENGPNYVPESRSIYSSFLKRYKPWKGHVVISDANTMFAKKGVNIFEDLGFDAAPQLNSASHGMLSINDGVIHREAKAKWVAMCSEGQPQWERTLNLVWCIRNVDKGLIARKWKEHFQMGMQPSLQHVTKFLYPKEEKNAERKKYWDACQRKYKAWVDANGEPEIVHVPFELETGLDGEQWVGKASK